MKIKSIVFKRRIFKNSVFVTLENGMTYKLKLSGDAVIVIPSPEGTPERETLLTVYQATWQFLDGEKEGEGVGLDRGAKIACARLVKLLSWPADAPAETEDRLHFVVDRITKSIDIF